MEQKRTVVGSRISGAAIGVPVAAFVALFAVVAVTPLRRRTISRGLLFAMKRFKLVPRISQTERAALEAGDTWIERELFCGRPRWDAIRSITSVTLSEEERKFLEGPVERLCEMVDDWQVWRDREIPRDVWSTIKAKGFLGMIIPKEYGGLGFSASAHSAVIKKLHSRSIPLSISVMVPNSLGPAELLLNYGTEEQKRRYLPKLATGEEIPCFALTEPEAGSDAASLRSHGEVFRGADGKLYVRLNWEKRWITLAAIATVIGLAFRLKDPGNLLGKGENPGITCALIPRRTPGITIDRRHDPMGVPFYNSPIFGKDVVVPLEEAIIGGKEGAGRGWAMLMESLAAGRGISLPAQAAGGSALVCRVASAHALVRRQFGLPIGRFEGVAEALGKIGGMSYAIEALRRFTCAALDAGKRPAVVTAIAKYQSTELSRKIINHGMDVMGGAGISLGPKNLIANFYIGSPISITVEGANILTRTLIVFGQGLLRLHPFIRREVRAAETNDAGELDSALLGHARYAIQNVARAFLLSATRGGRAEHRNRLDWASACFAALADLSFLTLGGKLKFSEKLSGRFADALGWMYIASALLYRFETEGSREEDRPFLEWGMAHAYGEIQNAYEGILGNHPAPLIGPLLRRIVLPIVRLNRIGSGPDDRMDIAVARLLMKPGEQRERLFDGIFIPNALARLEEAMRLAIELETSEESKQARRDAVQVDSFTFDEYLRTGRTAA